MKAKKLYTIFCLLTIFILLIFSGTSLFSQWMPSVRLTNDTASSTGSWNHTKWIAADGNSIHVVWMDRRSALQDIYYKRSTNNGSSWGNDVKLSDDSTWSTQPSIAVSGSYVHVIWDNYLNGNRQLYYIRSTNGGAAWSNPTQLSTSSDMGVGTSISCDGSFINVVWVDMRHSNAEIYYKKSTDNGTTWNQDTRLTNTIPISEFPSIGQYGSTVHVAWSEMLNPGYEIYYKKSIDGGQTWNTDTKLTGGVTLPWPWPQTMSVSGDNIHIAYPMQVIASDWDIFYRHSTNGGITWLSESRLTEFLRPSLTPSIHANGSIVHLAWGDSRDYQNSIFYKRSTDGGFSWTSDFRVTNDTSSKENVNIAASSSGVHIVWDDTLHGNREIYYIKNPVLNGNFSVSGLVTFKDNNQPVTGGFVKALKYNPQTTEIITVDSAAINSNGTYTLSHVPNDSLDLMFYQDDDLLQFVPTYYMSTTDWREATKIYASQNLTNINCQVYRITGSSSPYNIGGLTLQNPSPGIIYNLNNVIVYAKIGNEYKNYGVSGGNGLYNITKLPSGTYTLIAQRMGFAPVTMNKSVSNSNLYNVNIIFDDPIGLDPISNRIPSQYTLSQNYPNPFNPVTTIKFGIPRAGFTAIKIFDILGRVVSTIVNENLKAGSYSVKWDAAALTSGIYFYRLETADYTQTRKMILIK